MLTAGCIFLWALIVWLARGKISHLLRWWTAFNKTRLDKTLRHLHRYFVFKDGNTILSRAHLSAGAGLFFSFFFRSIFLLFITVMGFFLFPLVWIYIVKKHRTKKFQKQLILFIPSLSSMLKTGHGLEKALDQLRLSSQPPLSDELDFALKEMHLGMPLTEALQRLHDRFPSDNMMMLIHAIAISRKLGTSLSEVMDHIAQSVLEKEKLHQHVMSLGTQGKLQAWVAIAMPFFLMITLQVISPRYFQPLFSTFAGHCCLLYCAISMITGLAWIYRITHKEYL